MGPFTMNWKSTTLVWGTGLLATWYAAVPPGPATTGEPLGQSPPPGLSKAAVEIDREATRLQGQLRRQAEFVPPVRNPFRFTEPDRRVAEGAAAPVAAPSEPPAPAIVLVGIAADDTSEGAARTAVLSTPGGVLLVRVGEEVFDRYRVTQIDEGAVELVEMASGLPLRLAFTP